MKSSRGGGRGGGRGGRGGARGGKTSKQKLALEARKRVSTSKREEVESRDLQKRIRDEAPAPGTAPVLEGGVVPLFSDMPLSRYTTSGLEKHKYLSPTEIQAAAIPHALAGCVTS